MDSNNLEQVISEISGEGNGKDITLEDICDALDTIFCRYMEEMESYLAIREKLTHVVNDGNLCVSKAKYVMGVTSVGALQIPDKEFTALLHCKVDEDQDSPFAIEKTSTISKSSGTSSSQGIHRKDEVSLRHRGKAKVADKETNLSAVEEIDHSVSDPVQDPIKWFGLLVPSSLRQGQTLFQKGVDIICELANSQALLTKHLNTFRFLKKCKKDKLCPSRVQ